MRSHFLIPLLVLLVLYQATADTCSYVISQRSGNLPSSANPSCTTIVYHFENSVEESYWSLWFSSFQAGNDLFTFYDGPDTFSPAIVTSPAYELNTEERFMSTSGWFTLQIARMTLDDVPSTWTAQYINWEQNNTVTDANGYSVYVSGDSYAFDIMQQMNGRASDYIGSVWVISPNPDWGSEAIAVNFELDDLVDTTGTLQVTVQYNGHISIIFDAADVGNSQTWYFYPSSDYGAKVIIRSQARTYAGSYSSFTLNAYVGASWEYGSSSSNSHFGPGIIVIVVGSLLGIGLIIGISVVVKKCYNRKKLIVQYQKLAMDDHPQQTPRYPQPMYVMMSPPQSYAPVAPMQQV